MEASHQFVVFWIPGAPRSPNRRPGKLRERMALARAERERAIAWAYVTKNREMIQPIFGPATVHFDVFRHRLLDADNSVSSLKHIQDGVCRVLLPDGYGPSSPYRW